MKIYDIYQQHIHGHIWQLDNNGSVDLFAYTLPEDDESIGDGCNGPKCTRCGYTFCYHCEDSIPHCRVIDLFNPSCNEEVYPREVLKYNFTDGRIMILVQWEASIFIITTDKGEVILDHIYEWSHASDEWDALKKCIA